ncbi:MAG: argonaute/piwi family protein [Nanobdellota archaeon]
MIFEAQFLDEQNLVFGGLNEEKDPKLGIGYYGPFRYEEEKDSLEKIRIGIIADQSMMEKVKKILNLISNSVTNKEKNKWLYPDFPGLSNQTSFKCSIDYAKSWEQTILKHDIEKILEVPDVNERIGKAVQLYISKTSNILAEDNTPNVIICCIPKEIEQYCGISEFTRGAKTPKRTDLEKQLSQFKKVNQKFLTDWGIIAKIEEKKVFGYDFRNALKGKIMSLQNAVPIQILRESTADAIINYGSTGFKVKQEPASFAWNFSTALFYKANGKPWRLAKLRQDTCYVGISFYRDKLSFNKDIETSMAQVFTHDGQGLVLRGNEVFIDERTKEPHLSEKQAEELLTDSINKYTERAGRGPARVVIHKSTLFTDAEKKGFSKAIGGIKRDYVTISQRKGIRFMRQGIYPVLRGTLISLADQTHLLFTSGYTPRIRTYPGHSIPQPLKITHDGDSQIKEICEEILGLTKLNWNTTSFSTFLPITLAFSYRVGQILSEVDKNSILQHHYKFYM